MVFKRFEQFLLLRLCLLGGSVSAFAFLFIDPRFHSATLLMFLLALAQGWELWLFLTRTNREVTRFLAAARYTDFSQSFDFEGAGGGFQELGEAFTDILARLKDQRLKQEVELRQLRAMLDHNPVPLIAIHGDGKLDLLNNAARRLFGGLQPVRVEDLRRCGEDLYLRSASLPPGEKALVDMSVEGQDTQLSLTSSEITTDGGRIRLISLQDIGRELEATQLRAWRDLVRVLTHEIMNSITPVASLSQTTADLAGDTAAKLPAGNLCKPDLDRIGDAARTVARRAGNLMQFVSNYRRLARLPEPERKLIRVKDLFDHLVKIRRAGTEGSICLFAEVSPPTLELHADPEQLEQTLINLLQNAEEALQGRRDGEVRLLAFLNPRGRPVIEVCDTAPGIPDKIRGRIFVPYFTTKPAGSGIGLALARQVMISHGGTIKAASLERGGSRFTLTF